MRLFGTGSKAFVEPPFWARTEMPWSSWLGDKEGVENSFAGYVQGAYKSSGPVFACMLARHMVFSEARFIWQRRANGRPTELFTDDRLRLLEHPWTNGTTGELLGRMEQDASLAGNFYATVVGTGTDAHIRRLRPDWVTIVVGSKSEDPAGPNALDAEVLGYFYRPGGRRSSTDPELLLPSEVAHYSPIPDPEAQFRGMSWLSPVISEIDADREATKHKKRFFKNGATTNFVVTYDKTVGKDAFSAFTDKFRESYEGTENAYKTIHLGGGADAKVVGANLQQLEFKATQGAGETRIAAASGVGAVIANLSEGMQGSSLNAGNFSAARRRFSDGTVRPLWRIAAGSMASIVERPEKDVELWFDDRDVPFLREDAKDAGEIQKAESETIARLVDAGFKPDAVIAAVTSGDLRKLADEHSGLFSVQLQEAGKTKPPPNAPPAPPAPPPVPTGE